MSIKQREITDDAIMTSGIIYSDLGTYIRI